MRTLLLTAVVLFGPIGLAWCENNIQSPPPNVHASVEDLKRAEHMAAQMKQLKAPAPKHSTWVHGDPRR